MSFILTLIIFGILIIVHEFGHFMVARRCGVRVEKFAIGFGPPLFKIRNRDTDFLICIFPLGGYVKLAGDNRPQYQGRSDEFLAKAPGVRASIVFSGVLFNYLFALVIFWLIALIGFPYQDTVIGGVLKDYPAKSCGLKAGDRIIAVDRKEVIGWRQLDKRIYNSKGAVMLTVQRGAEVLAIIAPLKREEIVDQLGRKKMISSAGIFPYQNTTIGSLRDDYPAKVSGLKAGDRITAVGGIAVDNWKEMAEIIHKSQNAISLTVEREGKTFSLIVPVKQEEITNSEGEKEEVSLIGIGPYTEIKFKQFSFFKAFLKGAETLLELTADILAGFLAILSGAVSFKESAAGPIGIFYLTSEQLKLGSIAVLQLMAVLNISLAVINLFPVPVLDGGHLLFLGLEKIRRKALSEKAEEFMSRLGLTMIILLIVFVFYNDTVKYGPEILDKLREKIRSAHQSE